LSEGDWDAEFQWAGKMLFLGSDDRGHIVYIRAKTESGGGSAHAFPPHFPRCLLRDGRGRPAQQEETEAGLPRGPLKGERPQSGYWRPYKAIEVKYILSWESLKREDIDEAVEQSMVKFCSVAATLRPASR